MTQQSSTVTAVQSDRDGLRALVLSLSLEEKVALLTGQTTWRMHALPSIGLRSIAMSDGPVGVRGLGEIAGETSALFPSPSAISATWDPSVAFEIGQAFAAEARGHGVDVILAPQVNIQRTPVGGRHFECYSEDPLLTAIIGTEIIGGIQDQGVAACVKHYIANDSETDRTNYVAIVDPQTMREVYLAPFERAVGEGKAWSIMAAYNQVADGVQQAPMTDHGNLVNGLLKNELGFDGAVVSDWMATRSTVGSALGGLDIIMPGPGGPWEGNLLAAVRSGEVPEAVIDDKVERILLLARRVGALDVPVQPITHDADPAALIAATAARATVVLKRNDAEPIWDRTTPATIALIGPNAVLPHVLGGGSSTVHPAHIVSPEEGLRSRFPAADVTVSRGGSSRLLAPELDLSARGVAPEAGGVITATYLDASGAVVSTHHLDEWSGWIWDVPDNVHSIALRVEFTLSEPGEHQLELGTIGGHRIVIDDVLVSEDSRPTGVEVILDSSINTPPGHGSTVSITEPRTVVIESDHLVTRAGGYGAVIRAVYRHRVPEPGIDAEIAAAVEVARAAELSVVIVGTNEEVESEGWDRLSLALPGRQNDLVNAVLDVDPDAVIVVNAGAPVILPWLSRARNVLWVWFPGQEMGHSLAAVLAGDVEAAGRLPWTLPADEADVPVPHARPSADGSVVYSEGVHVGYRGWEQLERTPAAPFGFGLGWTSWSYDSVEESSWTAEGDLEVAITVSNTGARDGRETVQLYLEPPLPGPDGSAEGSHDRPLRWLAGFTTIDVAAGNSRRVIVTVPRRSFEVWDIAQERWVTPAGNYRLRIGRSVRDIRLDAAVQIGTAIPQS